MGRMICCCDVFAQSAKTSQQQVFSFFFKRFFSNFKLLIRISDSKYEKKRLFFYICTLRKNQKNNTISSILICVQEKKICSS